MGACCVCVYCLQESLLFESSMLSPAGQRSATIESLHDEELHQIEHASPGPWHDTTSESFQRKPMVRQPVSKPVVKPTKPTDPSRGFLPVIPTHNNDSFRRLRLYGRRSKPTLDSSPLVDAYNNLVEQANAMDATRTENMERRLLQSQALRLGMQQLSPDRLQAETKDIRFNALKNEVDIFQQYLDPFVFEIRTPHEHSVHSSVYRHFLRMQAIHDMGIPIYSLGSYETNPNDKIIMPRTFESFYRRIRRRNTTDFIDANLITSAKPRKPETTG